MEKVLIEKVKMNAVLCIFFTSCHVVQKSQLKYNER